MIYGKYTFSAVRKAHNLGVSNCHSSPPVMRRIAEGRGEFVHFMRGFVIDGVSVSINCILFIFYVDDE